MVEDWGLSRRVRVSAGEVAYEVMGEGPAVVLVHGTPSRSFIWRQVARRLAESFTVYVYDLPGFGDSEKREGQDVSIAAQGKVVGELVGEWGLQSPIVAGHDIGGGIALRAHLLEGVVFSRIALLDAVILTPWGTSTLRHVKAHMEAYNSMPENVFEAIVAAHLRTATSHPLTEEAFEAYLSQWRGEEGRAAYLRKDAHLEQEHTGELEPLLGEVGAPVQIVWGEEDGWLDPALAERLGQLIPGSAIATVPGAGHFVMEDAPQEVVYTLSAFFSEEG